MVVVTRFQCLEYTLYSMDPGFPKNKQYTMMALVMVSTSENKYNFYYVIQAQYPTLFFDRIIAVLPHPLLLFDITDAAH